MITAQAIENVAAARIEGANTFARLLAVGGATPLDDIRAAHAVAVETISHDAVARVAAL